MDNKEFFAALTDLVREKGISEEAFMETLKNALASAYKKQYEGGAEVIVDMNRDLGTISFKAVKHVVETVEDRDREISLEDAQALDANHKIGDTIVRSFQPDNFGRIAAQTARQVILQKLHEAERESTFSAFSDKEGELRTGVIRKIDERNVYVELGDKKIEGVMPPQDRVATERYAVGDTIKVFVKRVKNSGRNSQIVVSRTHPGLVKRLFELEVPEIHDGTVVVQSIAREAGSRTKIAVYSADENVDPIGACVGPKGGRVSAIVDELKGEKIDIIKYSEDPVQFIAEALSPSDVLSVQLMEEGKSCVVVVPDDQLSLAIGKEGQNARLAAKLTGYKIDIKPQSQAQ